MDFEELQFTDSLIGLAAGTYQVTAINQYDCRIDSVLIIEDIGEAVGCDLVDVFFELPDVITPNGDGVNDAFAPIIAEGIVSMQTHIYNRWGREAYHSNGLTLDWNGAEHLEGTYFYVITYLDGNQEVHTVKGNVTLLK